MSQISPSPAEWIQGKLDTYKERSRKGIPRGQLHGIPKRKYHAALLHLAAGKSFNLRQIAKRAGVSYPLLLKWRTEDRFRELVEKGTREYCRTMAENILFGDPDTEAFQRFLRDLLQNYSAPLIAGFWEALISLRRQYNRKFRSSGSLQGWGRAMTLDMATIATAATFLGIAPGSKPDRIRLQEKIAEHDSFYLEQGREHFKWALAKGRKKELQYAFDKVSDLAREEIAVNLRLKKELIERGLDSKLADALKTKKVRKM